MSRPKRLFFAAALFASSLTFAGCGTIYDDMYSPRRSRFVPPPPKAAAPTDLGPIPAGDTTPSSPSPSTGTADPLAPPPSAPPEMPATDPAMGGGAPMSDPGMSTIPGL